MPLERITKAIADKVGEACSDSSLVKAAKFHMKPLNGLDILVCGRCLQVFHAVPDLQKHKQKGQCAQPESDPSKFNPSSNVWAFMLWKNSPACKKMKLRNAGDNSVWYKKWQEASLEEREAWTLAGKILFEMNSIHKSSDPEEADTNFLENFSQQISDLVESDCDVNTEHEESSPLTELKTPKKVCVRNILESKDLVEMDVTPRRVINKKTDKKNNSIKYMVQWEGQSDSKTSWLPEKSLSNHRDLIDQFEERISSTSRPCRSSKAKALHKVKAWALKKYEENDDEEENQSDVEDEEEVGDLSDDEFKPEEHNSTDDEKSVTTEDLEGSDSVESNKSPPRGIKRKIIQRGRRPKQVRKMCKFEEILHVSNCHRSIQVNAKTMPKVKPGIQLIKDSPSLLLLAPMLCKNKPKEEPSGLVVLTNNILRNRPGIRKRQGLKLFEDSAPKFFSQELPSRSRKKPKPKPKQTTSIIKILSSPSEPPVPTKKVYVPAKVNNKPTQNKIYTTFLPPADPRKTSKAPSYANISSTIKPTVKVQSKTTPNVTRTPRVIKAPLGYSGPRPSTASSMKRVPPAPSVRSTQPTISIQASGDTAAGPQHVEIPQGVDPGALEVPAGMQLMVSDNGEYYLLPQQPVGSTVALAHDPESGTVQVVAIPEQPDSGLASVNVEVNQPTTGIITPDAADTQINAADAGRFVLVMTKEGELMLIQTDQNSAVES
ncbi:Hypothetical predicted protein [Cloeon dipterum]|uniref:Chromo domain-containing protein n=1 Tax=Cloeon dipterum TaxID=197152 RepID=A0A8S1DA59_9INSE|nr:Hypothetical predicted protein [Cloeon dipterum]